MPTVRDSLLPVFSSALVAAAIAAVALDAARAQDDVPIRYGTDPGYAGEAPQVLSFRGEDAPAPRGEIQHTVRAGDTVYALGRLYQVTPLSIIDKNQLRAPYQLNIGQELMIPMAGQLPQQGDLPLPVGMDRRPVQRVATPATQPRNQRFHLDTVHVVQPGDTLYSLSRRYGMSVADLAAANNMGRPYTISVDQRLRIPGGAQPVQNLERAPRQVASAPSRYPDQRQLSQKVVEETLETQSLPELGPQAPFAWPVRGPVLADFGEVRNGSRSDGINIAAPIGAPVRATADGEVVYRGSELDGYGNLLLVKHENGWVSAYAHTDAILVRKGDFVRQGQVIAKVGKSGSVDRPQLHFQLRKDLQPQDPIVAMQGSEADPLTAVSLRR